MRYRIKRFTNENIAEICVDKVIAPNFVSADASLGEELVASYLKTGGVANVESTTSLLVDLEKVKGVRDEIYLDRHSISIEKEITSKWEELLPKVLEVLVRHLDKGGKLVLTSASKLRTPRSMRNKTKPTKKRKA